MLPRSREASPAVPQVECADDNRAVVRCSAVVRARGSNTAADLGFSRQDVAADLSNQVIVMTPGDPRIAWAVEQMSAAFHEPIRVSDLAHAVNLSPSRFTLLFRAEMGASPAHYLQVLRMNEARLLIQSTFLTVKEIMAKVGFNDPSHFTRSFARHHGVAPSRLRWSREVSGDLPVQAAEECVDAGTPAP
jgi:transcriptional regulator GlxA family with amidase domain